MATTRVHTNYFLLALALLALLVPGLLFAQDTTLTASEGGVDREEVATTTDSLIAAETAPWFRIEKLTGDNLAVGDFVVGPGRAELEVRPGETITYEISVTNRISDNRTFELTVEDITGSDDASRSVVLLGEAKGPYTIKDYISFPSNTFTLDLGDRARIPVTISIPKDAEPGGLYGSVLVSTVQVDNNPEPASGTRSPIIARVGTLFFVTIPGAVEKSGETQGLLLKAGKWWYEHGPIEMNVVYENTGSVHLNPYGEIRITNLFGEEVGFVELEPWFALPKSLRSREITWDRELLLGRYVATAKINRGYEDIVDEVSVVFWVVPWKVVVGVFVVVFIIVFGMRIFFRTFEFKRKS